MFEEAEMADFPEVPGFSAPAGGLIIDCDTCTVRGVGCGDCVVTALLDLDDAVAGEDLELDPAEAKALDALAAGGLIPPLRLTPRAQTG
jgi:hypothetical protein